MKKLMKSLLKSIIPFALAIALVAGAVPINGLVMVAKADGLSESGTAAAPYLISSTADWDTFAAAVSGGTTYEGEIVKLTDDISGITTMAGTSDHRFKGTFIGGGHTLTVNYTARGNDCAPFLYIEGATINTLKVAGNISTGYKYAAGIAAHGYGNSTIKNCWSSVAITSSVNGDGTHAGFVAVQEAGLLGITNCLFDGSITGSSPTNCGGLVGWRNATLTFTNCLMAGTMGISQTDGSALFNRNGGSTLANCYYDGNKDYGSITKQGTSTTATGEALREKLSSGWEVSDNKVVPIMSSTNLAIATISGVDKYYINTGEEIRPEPVVTAADGTTLTADTHYIVSTSPSPVKDTGVYNMTIQAVEGCGYVGSKSIRFSVIDALAYQEYDPQSARLTNKTVAADSYTVVTSETATMNSGWYAVLEDVVITDRIKANGDVHLVLGDGATLTAINGIEVIENHSLTIYSQSGNTGKLIANHSSQYGAAIGATDDRNHRSKSKGTITIHGGEIEASGSSTGGGIGNAYDEANYTINIYGGRITAHSGSSDGGKLPSIGGYINCSVNLGWCRSTDRIFADKYQGTVSLKKSFVLENTETEATTDNINGKTIVPSGVEHYTVTFDSKGGSDVETQSVPSGQTADEPAVPEKAQSAFLGWYSDEKYEHPYYFSTAVTDNITLYAKWQIVESVSYIGPQGQKVTLNSGFHTVESYTTELTAGTWYVCGNRTVSGRMNISGEVNLVLGDGVALNAERGIAVTKGNTLNIFVQTAGNGALTAKAPKGNINFPWAAIGGNEVRDHNEGLAGIIRIYGGTISAEGSDAGGAAIGESRPGGTGHTGTIEIYGGKVTATAGVASASSVEHEMTGTGIGATPFDPNNTTFSIVLGYRNDGSFIKATNYNGKVTVADGLMFVTDDNPVVEVSGTVTDNSIINGKKLTPKKRSVDFELGYEGGNAPASQTVLHGFTASVPTDPTRDGYVFDGWRNGNAAYDFSAAVTEDLTLTAHWKKLMSNADISVTIPAQTYTGSAITPDVTVKDGETNITDQCDIAFVDNTNAGSATVTITAKSDSTGYTGSTTKTFTINPASVTLTANSRDTDVYDGTEKTVKGFTASVNGLTFAETVTASGSGTNAGEYDVTFSGVTLNETKDSTGNYVVTGTTNGKLTISKKPVTISKLSAENKTYDGSSAAVVKGTASIIGAKSGDDVRVSAGTAAFADKNVGTGKTVTFSGYSLTGTEANNYKLSAQPVSVTADITAKPVTIANLTVSGKEYDGTTNATVDCSGATFTGKIGGDTLSVSGVTGTFADKDVAAVKTVTLNYRNAVLGGTDAGNYTIAESGNQAEATAAITKKTVTAVSEISRTNLYTTGGQGRIDVAALLPADRGMTTYTVTKSGSVTYSVDPAVVDGILTYTVNPGDVNNTGTITVKAETLNYTDFTITVNVKLTDQKPVELKDGTSVVLNKSTLTYGEALSTLTFKTNTAVFVEQGNTSIVIAGTLEWKTPMAVPAAGTTSATWVFTPNDPSYAALEDGVAITVNKATPVVSTAPVATAITYGQALEVSTFSGELVNVGETAIEGTFAWKTGTVKPTVADSNKTEYDVIFTPTDTVNYESAECKVKIIVNKANPTVTSPTAKTGHNYTGVSQALVTEGSTDGGTLQYALGETQTTAPTSGWSVKVPTGINAGAYYVWYKVVGDENYNDSTPGCVEATIAPAQDGSDVIPTVEVQCGTDVEVTLNLKAYIGTNAASQRFESHGNSDISFSDENLNGSTLTFKVSSQNGGTGSIELTVSTENYTSYKLTIPVKAQAKTTEVRLEETTGVSTAVQGVEVKGLDEFTNGQTGDKVKVELNVKTESAPSDNTVKSQIEDAVSQIFLGFDSSNVDKEYLDISVKKTVDGITSTATDVGGVIEIAVKYDLNGKFNPVVIREHDGSITKFTALSEKPTSGFSDGTFYVDASTGTIYIYTQFFSTYAIAYATAGSCTVKFDAQGGSDVDPIVVQENGKIPADKIPASNKGGYSFEGWFTAASGGEKLTDSTEITSNITYYAHWTSNGGSGSGTGGGGCTGGSGGGGGTTPTPTTSYTVSFEANGGSGTMASQTITGTAMLNANAFTWKDHTFIGWNTKADGSGTAYSDQASITPTADMTLYAQWKTEIENPSDNVLAIDEEKGIATVKDDVSGGTEEVPLNIITEGLIYRMYDPNRGEHFYTKDPEEAELLVQLGWIHESGSDFAVVSATEEDAVPVYRFYNPNCGGMHFFTADAEEAKFLKSIGWNYEGISHYVYTASSTKGTPQYRLYNPNSPSGEHNWTSDEAEVDMLKEAGWVYEGICWRIV